MRNRLLKWLLFLIVYIVGVAGFSNLSVLQQQQTVNASDLTDPTLPVMCIDINGRKIDRMYGYTMELEASEVRECLIPMTTKRSITVSYKAYDNTVTSVSYEVSAPDTGEVIENAKIGNFAAEGDYRTATFSLSEPILMNREYPIRFTIQTEAGDVYYYARIVQTSDPVTDKYVQFVYDFYEGCIGTSGTSEINSYLETDDTITNNSYTGVTIKSSLSQVTWGNLNPQIYRKAVPVIKEIYGETCTITNDYLLSAENENGEEEIYHVHEYYRLRYYNSRIMLLNFERTALQVFDASLSGVMTTSGVNLGVAEKSVDYMTNEAGNAVAFVQDNELWEYNNSSQKLSRVFSFHDVGTETDERDDNNLYGIKIIRVTEGGGIDFVVYGYMSRGQHEGEMGAAVCRYNAETTAVSERAFIPYTKSYELLKEDLDKLCYVNNGSEAYFYMNRTVLRVDLATNEVTTVLEDVNPDCFVSSSTGSVIAWMEEMESDASTGITLMELEEGTTRQINAGNGQYIRALGFLNEDFIYGLAEREDVTADVSGRITFAMNELCIESFDGTLVKDYKPDGCYVTGVTMEPGLANLSRSVKTQDGYEETTSDNIINNRQNLTSAVTAAAGTSSRQGTIVTLKFSQVISTLKPAKSDFRMRYLTSENCEFTFTENDTFELYYVYGHGKLLGEYTDPAYAVQLADENVGTVLNQEWQYIYERGNKDTKQDLNNEDIPENFLSGEIDARLLEDSSEEGVTVLNLSGCTLEQVLYQVSEDRAVVTRLADGSTAVIVGYDRYNTLLYNFETGEHYYMGINDSTESMLAGGNYFVTYIEKQATIKGN